MSWAWPRCWRRRRAGTSGETGLRTLRCGQAGRVPRVACAPRKSATECSSAWNPALSVSVARVLSDDERTAIEQIFRAHGYDEPLRIAASVGDDECIFVLPAPALAQLP